MATPAALMLFGGHLEVQHEEGLVSTVPVGLLHKQAWEGLPGHPCAACTLLG